jgi:hypothetical protein
LRSDLQEEQEGGGGAMTKIAETVISQGGLMRCCIETIYDYIDTHGQEPITEPLVLDCKYERPDQQIILSKNVNTGQWVWRWNREAK